MCIYISLIVNFTEIIEILTMCSILAANVKPNVFTKTRSPPGKWVEFYLHHKLATEEAVVKHVKLTELAANDHSYQS